MPSQPAPPQALSSRIPCQGGPLGEGVQVLGSHLYVEGLQKEAGVFLQDIQQWQGQHAVQADGQEL